MTFPFTPYADHVIVLRSECPSNRVTLPAFIFRETRSIILPAVASISNQAAAMFTDALDFDSNVDDNAGADQHASVTFNGAQDGKDGLT